jgi:2-methylcitrate dehydratase PrpD
MDEPAASAFARFATALTLDEVPADVAATAARHVLDAVGTALAAAGTGAGDHARTVAAAQGGVAEATAIGTDERLPAPLAAFANGTLAHALDFDDTHEASIAHVSAVVAPAALAAGEACGASGADVLCAYVAGVETIARLGVASPALYERGFHPTSVLGVFGATAAAARAQGLDQATTTHAIGIAGSFASGLFAYLDDGAATKPLHAGWAAQAGVQAVALARAGATGPARVIEGRFGLFFAHASGAFDLRLDDLGSAWETGRVSLKAYPACHFSHAPVHQVASLGVAPDDVAAIEVAVPPEGVALVLDPIGDKQTPRTPYDAKFSAPWCIAARLVTGRLDVRSFSTDAIADPAVLALAARVTGTDWGDEPPPSRFAGRVTVTTAAGDVLRSEPAGPPGTPAAPLTSDEVLAKFRANATLLVDDAAADRLAKRVLALGDAPDVASLLNA